MLERALQDYLYEYPDVLFPGEVITSKRREVFIQGRRIDLLFEVGGIHYIVELKRATIGREDIGQIFEYYGLMRQSNEAAKYKMILVAPAIPAYRRIPLEEFGIRCVEVQHPPKSTGERAELVSDAVEYRKRKRAELTVETELQTVTNVCFEELNPPATKMSVQLSHLLLRDGLPQVQKSFSDYEVLPVKMLNVNQFDMLCLPEAELSSRFFRGGAWWAYSFGHSEEMPQNDIPNISVNALPWGLDFAINAELRTSQEVMRQRVAQSTDRFDGLVVEHDGLELQAWLKFEHQPRFYHWILIEKRSPGHWVGKDLLDLNQTSEIDFTELREYWLGWIKDQRAGLSQKQVGHLQRTNRKLNLALRLVRSFQREDPVWDRPYQEQLGQFQAEYRKLKPLIDFFQ